MVPLIIILVVAAMIREFMRSKFTGFFAFMLAVSFVSVCSGATDPCKEYAVNKEYDKAVEECTKQINGEIAVKYLEYSYSNRGAAYANKKQYDEAISDYTKAIELNPGYATAYYNRAIAYANKKQYDDAISDFGKVIELRPGNSAAYVGRATAYANKKQFDKAISDYTKAIELNPKDSAAYDNRATVYASRNQFDQAVSDRNKAIELSDRTSSPATPESQPVANQARKAIYYVQLGIFKNEINAAALTKRFKKKGYNVFVMKSPAKGNGTLYRVLIGRFEDRHESKELAAKIGREEKITPVIFSE